MKSLQKWSEKWGVAAVIVFMALVLVQIVRTATVVKEQAELAASTVLYFDVKPEKPEYHPGDLISFTYTRIDKKEDNYPLLLTTIDSFENKDTGEIYPGQVGARVILHSGTEHRRATRRLADWATPGTYVWEGSAKSETARMSRASYILSAPFKVTGSPNLQRQPPNISEPPPNPP